MEPKSKMVNVRLIGNDLTVFEDLCRQDVRDQSSMLRFLILKEHERREAAKVVRFNGQTPTDPESKIFDE